MTKAHNLAHSVMGEVCRIEGHLGHPSGGVLPGQGIVGGSSSIKLCSGEKGRGCDCGRARKTARRLYGASETQSNAKPGSRPKERGRVKTRSPPAVSLDSTDSEYGISHTRRAEGWFFKKYGMEIIP